MVRQVRSLPSSGALHAFKQHVAMKLLSARRHRSGGPGTIADLRRIATARNGRHVNWLG